MSHSSFAQSLFASTCVTGIIFSATALPFAALKSNVVNVELQNQPIFSSELQYLAAPYLTVAGGMSVAVGVGVFGVLGWRQSVNKLAKTESSKSELAKSLAVHQAELERIKFSDARLRTQNLSTFLQPETAWPEISESAGGPTVTEAQPIMPVHRIAPPEAIYPSMPTNSVKPTAVATYAKAPSVESTHPAHSNHEVDHEPLENLLSQIHQLSRQVEELRRNSSARIAA